MPKGSCPAEFRSDLVSAPPPDLYKLVQLCMIGVGAKLSRTVALYGLEFDTCDLNYFFRVQLGSGYFYWFIFSDYSSPVMCTY